MDWRYEMIHRFPVFVETFKRTSRLRVFLLRRLLRAHQYDFEAYDRLAAIVGDEISDQIRVQGRYEDISLRAIETLLLPHLACDRQYCLDVGANIGNHSIFFSAFFARVVAFEPNPLARTLLELNLQVNGANNVDINSVGLSDSSGTARLSVCRDNLGASRLKHLAEADPAFAARIAEEVEIDVVPGDSTLAPEISVGFIKIDVEGLESQVLRGLARTIEQHRPVIMLEQLAPGVDVATGRTSVTDFLTDFGYRPFEIQRIRRSRFKLVNDLLTYLFGNVRHALTPITYFERRDYSALLYLTDEIVELVGNGE